MTCANLQLCALSPRARHAVRGSSSVVLALRGTGERPDSLAKQLCGRRAIGSRVETRATAAAAVRLRRSATASGVVVAAA